MALPAMEIGPDSQEFFRDNSKEMLKGIRSSLQYRFNQVLKPLNSLDSNLKEFIDAQKEEAARLRGFEAESKREGARGGGLDESDKGGSKGGDGGGKAKGGGGGVIGKIGGMFGKLFGAIGGGALGGFLAGFVKVLGNPAMIKAAGMFTIVLPLIGAGIAGFITAIGAGLAGASKLMEIGGFVPLMKEFTTIDGKKLGEVGDGLKDFGIGMAAYGVGGAAAGFGSIVQNFSEGIVKFFGGDTPLEKLKQLGQFELSEKELKNIENNSAALVSFGAGFAAAGAGQAVSGLGTLVGGIATGIGKLFGGKDQGDIIADLKKFGAEPLPLENIEHNASALAAFSNAMSEAVSKDAKTSWVGVVGSIGKALGGLFAPETDFMGDMDKFTAKEINSTVLEKNAKSLGIFNTAMNEAFGTDVGTSWSKALGAMGKAISDLFGGEKDFLADMVKFTKITIKHDVLKGNIDSLILFNDSMKALSDKTTIGDTAKETIKSFLSSIGSLFSDDAMTKIKEQMDQFTAFKFDSEGIKKNSDDIQQVVPAMNSLLNLNLDEEKRKGVSQSLQILNNMAHSTRLLSRVKFESSEAATINQMIDSIKKLEVIEAMNGEKIKKNLIEAGKGLEEFRDIMDDGEIDVLADYVKRVAVPMLAVTGSSARSDATGALADGNAQAAAQGDAVAPVIAPTTVNRGGDVNSSPVTNLGGRAGAVNPNRSSTSIRTGNENPFRGGFG